MNPGTTISSKKAANKSRLTASPKRKVVKPAQTPHGSPTGSQTTVTPDELHRMIAVAAYCRAECRGFVGGNEVEDWLAAEAEIKKLLGKACPEF